MSEPWTLTFDIVIYDDLIDHLFPGDNDEHGAVIAAGIVKTKRGTRLVARELLKAVDGVDFVPGKRGYRRLTPQFVNRCIRHCRDQGLVYLAVHNHGGANEVGFSPTDNASHERGYPALLDISGHPVGALVFAENAIAGDIWTPNRQRRVLSEVVVLGRNILRLHPAPPPPPPQADAMFDRQVRWLGDRGQDMLERLKIAVIGSGGVGLPLVTMLARLGVGNIVVIDPDRVDPTNLNRLDVRFFDARMVLRRIGLPDAFANRISAKKVALAKRAVRRANKKTACKTFATNVVEPRAAHALIDCDFIFLAADSHLARMVFNAVLHQYLIPGIQIGTRIDTDEETGAVTDIRSMVRLVLPHTGCFRCNGLINPSKLQDESMGAKEREGNRYADEVREPSVISFNYQVAGQATSDFLLMMSGLVDMSASLSYLRLRPHMRTLQPITPIANRSDCADCGSSARSRRAKGDGVGLPLPER